MAQFNPDQLKGGTVVDSDGSKLKEKVTGEETVTEDVRKEQVEEP